MPSRKRTKGRARKLKQQAQEPAVERSVSQPPQSPNGENINLPEQNIRTIEQAENIRCFHGGIKIPQGHPIRDFIDLFGDPNVSIEELLKISFEKHEEVWKDGAIRKMAIDTMVSIGTELIIKKYIGGARNRSEAIIVFENYDGEGHYQLALSKATEDVGYLLCAEERDVVHFYKKRIPCSCLDELYSELKKSQDRGSQCFYCKQTVKRKDLKTCSRCKFSQYCSKECQISDWSFHKEWCMAVANIHERA